MNKENRIIFHIDVNSAFLSWTATYEKLKNPESIDLRTVPSVIGGDKEKRRGIILAKSLPAKKFNIQTGEPIGKALDKCPELIIAKPNYILYEKNSNAMITLLSNYTDLIEKYSIDEAFLDMSHTCHLFGEPLDVAHQIRERVYDELGFTVNIGVSSNKLLAKMASDFKKPNKVHTLFPEEISNKMWHLPVGDLFYVGRKTEKKLLNLDIHTIGQLAQTDLRILKSHLKSHGEVIWNFANGISFDNVESVPEPNKGYGNSTTTPYDVIDIETAKLFLLSLAETVSTRMRNDKVSARVISIGMRDYDFNYKSHQTILSSPTNITNEIAKVTYKLLEESWDGTPLRHLGIHVSRIADNNIRQLSLFDVENHHDKLERVEETIDNIRSRFGNAAVIRGCFVKSNVKSLSGGIPSEYKDKL